MVCLTVRPSGKRVVNSKSLMMVTTADGSAALVAFTYSSVKARGDSVCANADPKKPATNTRTPITRFRTPPPYAATKDSVVERFEQIKNKNSDRMGGYPIDPGSARLAEGGEPPCALSMQAT